MPRHRHRHGYAALVLGGGYVEAGDRGRFPAEAGDVLFHDSFEAHRDCFAQGGAEVLNLPLDLEPGFSVGRCADPDAIVRLAEADPRAAAEALLRDTARCEPVDGDWPDLLANDLKQGRVRLAQWSADHGLAQSSVSRGFKLAYGVSPQRYQLELRAAEAARAIARGAAIAEAGYAAGFADQPHLSRTLRALYGATARQLRSNGKCVQECGVAHR